MPQKALPNIGTGRRVLIRDRLPRAVADIMDTLPIPKIYFPQLNISRYPDTEPEKNPRRAVYRILRLTNAYRRNHGKNTLRLSKTLCAIARKHSIDQARRRDMTHTGGNGSSLSQRLEAGGYLSRLPGENIAMGYMNEEHVFQGWRFSPSHRENLLLSGVYEMGLAVVKGRDGLYWTQLVARRR